MHRGILTVSLNAAVDVVYHADHFAVDRINHVHSARRMAGGKANNVARVLAALGQPVIATGFAGGANGQFIQEDLHDRGVATAFVPTPVENRVCTTVIDAAGKTLTEIRERGQSLTEQDGDRFIAQFARLLERADLVIISGSLPPGLPEDFYGRLVSQAFQQTQVRCIVDASGSALRGVLPASPYLLKPNLDELQEWAGTPLPDERAVVKAARRLIEEGPLVVAVSLGARGLILVSPEGGWRVVPPAVTPLNTVGSGDSLVAGFAAGLMQGLPAEEILRLAVACGTANALTADVAHVDPADLDRLRPQVRVERL